MEEEDIFEALKLRRDSDQPLVVVILSPSTPSSCFLFRQVSKINLRWVVRFFSKISQVQMMNLSSLLREL